jgi:hypothetical protein
MRDDCIIGREIGSYGMDDLQWENLIRSYRRHHEQRRRSRLAGALILLLIILSLGLLTLVDIARADGRPSVAPDPVVAWDWTATREEYGKRINDFLTTWFAQCNPHKLAAARELVPTVLDVAEAERFNPAIIAAIITLESSWQPGALGKLGEVGLMQINLRGASADPAENIRTGIGMLREGMAQCGTVVGAISYYATGSRCSARQVALRRVRLAARIEALGTAPAPSVAPAVSP